MKSYLSVLVKNVSGVLTRISGLFARRGYNIESLSVCATDDINFSRMTIAVRGDGKIIEQIIKQLEKQEDVVRVREIYADGAVLRESLLVKLAVNAQKRGEIIDVCAIFKAKTVDLCQNAMILELTGTPEKIDAFVDLLLPYKITELARSGVSALERGEKSLKAAKEEL